jgi:8-oxo-dGTP pyrophosphatase MutT (NUDIX family)
VGDGGSEQGSAGPHRDEIPTDDVPIRSAATVVLLDDRPDLHVLALRRTDASTFVAGYTLFPGGAVDDGDHDARWGDLSSGAVGALPGMDDPLSYRIAVVRETIEEVGVVVGIDDEAVAADLVARRRDLESGAVSLADLVSAAGAHLDLSGIHPVARWVTPMPSIKRYDTAFFVARAPAGSRPVVDGREAVHAEWCRPADALERWEAGELTMISPTIAMFQRLASWRTVDEVLAATTDAPVRHVRILDDSTTPVRFEGDDDYDAPGTRATLGWVWLPAGPLEG